MERQIIAQHGRATDSISVIGNSVSLRLSLTFLRDDDCSRNLTVPTIPPKQMMEDSPVLELQFGDKFQEPKKCRALVRT